MVFSKVKESSEGKLWHVEAIHATTTRNNRIYSEEELRLAARSLSKRPINYNHDESRFLPYDFRNPFGPLSNSTVFMEWDASKQAVVGDLWITDAHANSMIEAGKIQTVSIEQTPTKGESCSLAANIRTCEQRGIVFDAIGILETYQGVQPGDPNAIIRPKESMEPVKKEDDDKKDDADMDDTKKPTKKDDDDKEDEASYPWDKCIADQTGKGYDMETAKKICGSIKAANELKKGCGCEKKKSMIDELAKLERFMLTGKLE